MGPNHVLNIVKISPFRIYVYILFVASVTLSERLQLVIIITQNPLNYILSRYEAKLTYNFSNKCLREVLYQYFPLSCLTKERLISLKSENDVNRGKD